MELKKNPRFNLQNYNKLFVILGLVFALFIVYIAIKHNTIKDLCPADLNGKCEEMVITELLQPVKPPSPPPPPPLPPSPPTPLSPPSPPPEIIEIVEDDEEIVETVFETTETEEEAVEVEEVVES